MLICSNRGLIIARHNKIRDYIIHIARKDFSHNCVCGKTLIHKGHRISEGEVCHGRTITETQGDVSIRGLWESRTDAIIDIIFGDSNSKTYVKKGTDTILPRW